MKLFAAALFLAAALVGCDSDPRDTPAPSVDDLIAAYGDQLPGTGVVHEGARVSTNGLIQVDVAITTTYDGSPFFRTRVNMSGDSRPFALVAALRNVRPSELAPGYEASLVSYFCCNGGGGVGSLVVTDRTETHVSGVFYADVQSEELVTNPRRYMGGFNATLPSGE